MGADNPDITVIVQYRIPEQLDSPIQRKGRASRNGQRQASSLLIGMRARYDYLKSKLRKTNVVMNEASPLRWTISSLLKPTLRPRSRR